MPFPSPNLFPSEDLFPGPPFSSFTGGVLRDYSPWGNDDSIGYLSALGSMFEVVFSLVVDQGDPDSPKFVPGWSSLLDPNSCPTAFLPFLSQFNGTGVQPGTDDVTARALIRSEGGYWRGTVAAMRTAALRHLTGTQELQILERIAADGTPDAYHMVLVFRQSQCPSLTLLKQAVEAQKPGGIQVTYVQSTSFTWNDAIHTWMLDGMPWNQTAAVQP